MLLTTFTARLFLQPIHSCSRLLSKSRNTVLQVPMVLADITKDKYHSQPGRIPQNGCNDYPILWLAACQPDLMLDAYVDPLMSNGF